MTTLEDRLRYFEGCGYARHTPAAAAMPAATAAGRPEPALADLRFWSGLGAGIGLTLALMWVSILIAMVAS